MVGRRGPGLVGTMARTAVVAGTASAVSGNVHRRQAERYNAKQDAAAQAAYESQVADQSVAQMAAMQAQLAALQAQPAAPAGDDITAQLMKLGELKSAGILSDEEFAAAKAKLLGA
jgi:hypothetical protein